MQNDGFRFNLNPRHRVAGKPFGDSPAARRGLGDDQISVKPLEYGDDPRTIDWDAHRKHPDDELQVRVYRRNESLGVVLIVDHMPSMQNPDPGNALGLLEKHATAIIAGEQIIQSTKQRHGAIGYRDFANGELFMRRADGKTRMDRVRDRNLPYDHFGARAGQLAEHLKEFRSVRGAFVFVLSDFLDDTLIDAEIWKGLVHDYDPVPVLIQDPIWEQTFPENVSGLILPFRSDLTGRPEDRRYSRDAARLQKRENETRLIQIRETFRQSNMDWIELASTDPFAVNNAFVDWAGDRKRRR